MNNWYIGIDETGSFNHLDPNDGSNVSAVVTKKSPEELFKIFHAIAREKYRFNKKLQMNGNQVKPESKELVLGKFHGCEQRNKFEILDALLEKDSGLIQCIIQSKGRPFVTANPQQWWMAAVLGVLQKFFNSGRNKEGSSFHIENGDSIHIEIASRKDICLGLMHTPSKKDFETYNKIFAAGIEDDLKQTFKKFKIKVSVQAAGHSELPTLGDQASNMIKPDYQQHAAAKFKGTELLERITPIITAPFSASLGISVSDLLDKNNLQGALEALLSEVLNGNRQHVELLDEIIRRAREPESLQIWQTLIVSCETALHNRGTDGNAVNHAGEILSRLSKLYNHIPNDNLKNKLFQIYAEYMGNAGKWDPELFNKIKKSFLKSDRSFSTPLKRWNFYLNILSAKAQTYFNVYKFGELDMDYQEVLKVQDQIDKLEFPFDRKDDPDQNFSEIYGTIGQDRAFMGQNDSRFYEEAVKFLEKDFNRAPDSGKSICASFLCVVYFKQKKFKDALAWHEKQNEYTPNKKDQWLVLDKLRIGALASELNEKYNVPDISSWHNEGDFPWSLLLKWSAYIEYKKGNMRPVISRLRDAAKNMSLSSGFTIRTLALSVIAMQIFIAQDGHEEEAKNLDEYRRNYAELLQKCEQESQSFKRYVRNHPQFEKVAQKADSLWEAANLLPFNFA